MFSRVVAADRPSLPSIAIKATRNSYSDLLHLLLSNQSDILCHDLRRALQGSGACLIEDFFGGSAKVALRVGSGRSSSLSRLANGTTISDREILGVIVRKPSFEVRDGWSTGDAKYLYAEKEAALLGWIWSLCCPVINLYTPELWFGPCDSLAYWSGRLEQVGLEPERSTQGVPSRSYLASVIGSRVIWDEGAPKRLACLNNALLEFTRELGLTYVEFRIDDSINGPRVSAVEPFPKYDGFCLLSRQKIVAELIAQLTSSKETVATRTESDSWF